MKKSNIAFSGFMAAILFSAGAANAATQIASKQYVDNRETSILQTVSNTYETKENVTNLTEQVTQLGDTINNEESGLTQQITNITQQIGDSSDGLVKDVDDLQTQVGTLDSELDSKLDSATAATTYEVLTNKATAINEGNQTSPTAYPSVGAIVQWTNKKIADLSDTGLPVNPDNINDNSIAGSKLENGAVTGDKIGADAVNGDKIADDSIGAEHIKDGAVDSAAIADGTVTEADLNTGLASKINGKQDKNVGAGNSGKILTVGADGNITTSATIAQARVDGLETALADKAAADDLDNLDTRVGLAENDIDALQTTVGSSTDGLVADVAELQKTASTLGTTYEQIANRTDTLDNATTASKYPTAGAVRSYVASEIAALDESGLAVNPDNIKDGSLPGSKLQDGAITTDKIANSTILKEDLNSALQTEIEGKADLSAVYTRQQTNDKIVEIAIQQPQNTCTSESDLCVLTLTKDNKLAWVPVTEPATAPVDAGPVMGSQNTDISVD